VTGLVQASELSPPAWSTASYPDEAGFQTRMAGMIERIASENYLRRSMALSICPDTGLPVYSWAVQGEEIISPYTGRRYLQGDTGFFGPKRRDSDGRIAAFGGDPLKVALPPATANVMLGSSAPSASGEPSAKAKAIAYLSIPGNLRQQYHFAAVNWVRLLGLAGAQMPASWHERFEAAVAAYDESRPAPDDAVPDYQPLVHTENLVGVAGQHLGGGGTENHKTMWRSSALYYAQTFPAGAKISGFPRAAAEQQTATMLSDFTRQLFTVGNGEYDSSTYYPYSIRAFANLFDFSPQPATRAMAQAALDYYFATYGLKVFNGVHTGPQRRGWVEGDALSEMETLLYAWAGGRPGYTTVPVDPASWKTSLHQATTSYRPNRLVLRLLTKEVPLPFEARLNHPNYGMTVAGAQPEYFYCSKSFAMGSVQLETVNNSAQQTTWSLNVRGPRGSLLFTAGQPRWLGPEGHSPYDQWVQHRGALVFMTGASAARSLSGESPSTDRYELGKLLGPKSYARNEAWAGTLDPVAPPLELTAGESARKTWFEKARTQAATWLYFPREATVTQRGHRWIVETPDTWVVVTPLGGQPFWLGAEGTERIAASREIPPGTPATLRHHFALVIPMQPHAGFAIEALERSEYRDLAAIDAARLTVDGLHVRYESVNAGTIELDYQPAELRPRGRVNGSELDWAHWANGAVVESPYLRIANGRLWLSDGQEAYEMTYTSDKPEWTSPRP
jgi:hypothetical protein